MTTPEQLYSFWAPTLLMKLSNHCSGFKCTSSHSSSCDNNLFHISKRGSSPWEKISQSSRGCLVKFPRLNCHLTLHRILAQRIFGLAPAGLGGGEGKFQVFVSSQRKGCCEAYTLLWRWKPGISCFEAQFVDLWRSWPWLCKIFITSSRVIRVQM